MLNSKVYDVLKYICIIGLPAIITLFGVIGQTLAIPYTQQILTIAVAVNTCLGSLLGISTIQYNNKKEGEQ